MLIVFNAPVARPLTEPEALAWTAPEGKAMGFDYWRSSTTSRVPRAQA